MKVNFNAIELTVMNVNGRQFLKYLAKSLNNVELINFNDYYNFLDYVNNAKKIPKTFKYSNNSILNLSNDIFNNSTMLRIVYDRKKILIQVLDDYYDFLIKFNNDDFFNNFRICCDNFIVAD